jgi:hypothetical protein
VVADGSYFTMIGNLITMNNSGHGFMLHPRTGCQHDGGLHSQSNGGNGVNLFMTSTYYQYGPLSGGTAYRTSTTWKNGGWGIQSWHAQADAYIDCGAGGANANVSGSVLANYGSNIHGSAGDAGISATCSPAWQTIGNGNSWIG